MKEQRKTNYSLLYYQRNEDKPKYLFLNYRRNEDEAKYLFLNYRRNEDKPKYLFFNYRRNEDEAKYLSLNYRRNEDEAKYSFLNYRWFDIASPNFCPGNIKVDNGCDLRPWFWCWFREGATYFLKNLQNGFGNKLFTMINFGYNNTQTLSAYINYSS
jgi:hypothetical protein